MTVAVRGLFAAFVLTGCFDVHRVDPGPILIDDFEVGLDPQDPAFQRWQCDTFKATPDSTYSCDFAVGRNSNRSIRLKATIHDPPYPIGLMDHGGAWLKTSVTDRAMDFTPFEALSFDVMLDKRGLSQGDPLLSVHLGCDTVAGDGGPSDGGPSDGGQSDGPYVYSSPKPVAGDWPQSPWLLGLSDLNASDELKNRVKRGTTTACLKRVDSIWFFVDAGLLAGTMGDFALQVDNVTLQNE